MKLSIIIFNFLIAFISSMKQKLFLSTPKFNESDDTISKIVVITDRADISNFLSIGFLKYNRLMKEIKGIQGYTGFFYGSKVTVITVGTGMPISSKYYYELFNIHKVEVIIKVGSTYTYNNDVDLHDIIIATGASTDSNLCESYNMPGFISGVADVELVYKAIKFSRDEILKKKIKLGQVFTTVSYFQENKESYKEWNKMGILANDINSYELYLQASRAGKKGLSILSISKHYGKNKFAKKFEEMSTLYEILLIVMRIIKSLIEEKKVSK